MVPIFGLTALTVGQSVAVRYFIRACISMSYPCRDDRTSKDKMLATIGFAIIYPWFELFFGWIIKELL